MKIIFKKVRYKNLLSTGDIFTEIKLDTYKTTLISGTNGSGKSTLFEAIIFGLYGKTFRKINKPQLINSVNQKDLIVELFFSIGKNEYKIIRGMKPNIFEIYKDDKMLNQDAAIKDYQTYFEKNILKLSYKAFTQIVILGSATYTPFMDLSAASRREVIEDLLDIQVFSVMSLLTKDKISTNKDKIKENEHSLELIDIKLKNALEQSENSKKKKEIQTDKIKSKVKDILALIDKKNEDIVIIQEKTLKLSTNITDKKKLKNTIIEWKDLRSDIKKKNNDVINDNKFYENNDNCPVCRQSIDKEFKSKIILQNNNKKENYDDALSKIEQKLEKLEHSLSELEEIENDIMLNNNNVSSLLNEIKFMKTTLSGYKKELEEVECEKIDENLIEEYKKDKKEIIKEQEELFYERDVLSLASIMLKDSGIKSKIVKQFIPIMNKLINHYLSIFELYVDFNLDENFNETLKSRYRDNFSYSSFSEGEKMRINLSILLAWRSISKMRNSISTNLMALDEILDGAADESGVDALINILNNINEDDNIFVISHRSSTFADKFDAHIEFKKVKGFSEYEVHI